MGRPAHKPDPASRRQVEALAGYGVPEIDIAGVVGIDPKSLRKHYREELDNGHVKANAKVAENPYRKATGDDREAVIAAIFWLKTRAGWKETTVHEMAGKGGGLVEERSPRDLASAIILVLARAQKRQLGTSFSSTEFLDQLFHERALPAPGKS